MSDPVDKKKRATYQDVLDAPENKVAEIVNGELHLAPRPAMPHGSVATGIVCELAPPFGRGRGGPGGWVFVIEPELHLGEDVLVPDIAGWRRDRMPHVPDAAFATMPPDWVCEVLSLSNEKYDRIDKMPIYATAGVRFAWLVNPTRRMLEAYRLVDGRWSFVAGAKDNDRVRIEPFEAIELDLAMLWMDSPLPSRAQEQPGHYEYDPPHW